MISEYVSSLLYFTPLPKEPAFQLDGRLHKFLIKLISMLVPKHTNKPQKANFIEEPVWI
jgi:hypothetical protein